MGSFQEEIRQIQLENVVHMRNDPAVLERNRMNSEPYIESICDSIRRRIKIEAMEEHICYDLFETFRRRMYSGGFGEKIAERRENPHYLISWGVQCELDVSQDRFTYDPKEGIFCISEVCTIFYILEEVEKRLKIDRIYPVECQETAHVFLHGHVDTKIKKIRLRQADGCRRLEALECGEGSRADREPLYVRSKFAYFLPENKN